MIINIDDRGANLRIDAFLPTELGVTRKAVQKKLHTHILVNGEDCKKGHRLRIGDIIEIRDDFFEEKILQEDEIKKYDINLEIVYQDSDIAVINKPAGLTTHPGSGNSDETLVNALMSNFKELSDVGGLHRVGIVHRLDKDTSGLIVIAKNNAAHVALSEEIERKDNFERRYIAICNGMPVPPSGTIELYMKKGADWKMYVTDEGRDGKYSKTEYETKRVLCGGSASIVECKLFTGRTHQIRLHMSNIKHSVIGDKLYGLQHPKIRAERQMLHAYSLSFMHPITRRQLSFSAELPRDMNELIKSLEKTY